MFVVMAGAGAFVCNPTLLQRNMYNTNRPAAAAAAAFNSVDNRGSSGGSFAERWRVSMVSTVVPVVAVSEELGQ